MKKYIYSILIGLVAAAFVMPGFGMAAEVLFEPNSINLSQEKSYTVTLLIDTQGESINAIEGSLAIDPTVKDVTAVSDSGSVITYWINRPEWNKPQKTVEFRGTIPGGFTGKGILFSLVMPPPEKSSPIKPFTLLNLKAFRNDGLGSQVRVTVGSFVFGPYSSIVDGATDDQLYLTEDRKDNIAPEVFSPQISRDERVFGGKWFISFSTQDKQSGVDHYELQETRSGRISAGNWKVAESPYLLEDQELHSYVYVLAIDRQGNERVIKVFPRNALPWHKQYSNGIFVAAGVIILVMVGLLAYRFKHKKHRTRKNDI